LLSLLAGLDIPESGEILFQGEAFSGLSEDQRAAVRRGRIGFVFQSFQLLQGLTAVENVMLPLELTGMSVAQAKQRAMKWLERVGLGARTHHRPRMLSGGEQQRVALARAFVNEPALLFADEPTGNLDRRTGESVSELLFELNQETGTTLILVTHDERLASRCQRILSLEDGTFNEVAA
jgi:putative ABC transport system ATP-binding protein